MKLEIEKSRRYCRNQEIFFEINDGQRRNNKRRKYFELNDNKNKTYQNL